MSFNFVGNGTSKRAVGGRVDVCVNVVRAMLNVILAYARPSGRPNLTIAP